ncbi:HYR domain-containing protein, partial [Salinimicrobium gaetbulicola]
MGKITLVVFRTLLTGITFFSFLLLTASNPTGLTNLKFSEKATLANTKDEFHKNEITFVHDIMPFYKIQLCTITAPSDVSVGTSNDDNGNCTTTVSLGSPTVSNCAGFPAKAFVNNTEIDPVTYLFSTGTTTVTWQISDGLNILASDDQIVEVVDNEDPNITCLTEKTRNTNTDTCTYVVTGTEFDPAGYSDNCPGATITNNFNNSTSLAGTVFPKGTTTVRWTITDATGINSVSCSFDVVVTDNEIPEISCINEQNRVTDAGECTYTAVGTEFDPATFGDNCPGATITNDFNNSNSLAGAVFPEGTTTVTWTVIDATGNNSQDCSFNVIVTDNEDPGITAPSDVSVNTDSGECFASSVNLGTPDTADNCSVASVSNNAPSTFPTGTTTVTWTVTDDAGNTASGT